MAVTSQKVTVVAATEVILNTEWVLRGIRDTGNKKVCIAEERYNRVPTPTEIALFLYRTKADFCSVERNYRIEDALPF